MDFRARHPMLAFYVSLARPTLSGLWDGFNRIVTVLLLAAFVLILLNQPLGQQLVNWDGVSPWWALAPAGVLGLYGLLRANYARYANLSRELASRATLEEAQLEFYYRLTEGNAIARDLHSAHLSGIDATKMQKEQTKFGVAVTGWNAACRETVSRYLPHRTWSLDAPIRRDDVPSREIRWRFRLREEVTQKIERMGALQSELAFRDSAPD